MTQSTFSGLVPLAAATLLITSAQWAAAGVQLTPQCGPKENGYTFKDGMCVAPEKFNQAQCTAAQGTFNASTETCSKPVAPTVSCAGGPRISYDEKLGVCSLNDSIPKSNPSNFVGDCLVQKAAHIPNAPQNAYLYVLSQSEDGSVLRVIPAEEKFQFCQPAEAKEGKFSVPEEISTADVKKYGALRRGYVYGALVTPYKYYPAKGEFETTGLGLMPYIGRRVEMFNGTKYTVISAGIGKAPTVDKDGKVNGQATVFSIATGMIFELNKSETPYRWGILVGRDLVGKGAGAADLKYGNKPWVAVQFGFDFTD